MAETRTCPNAVHFSEFQNDPQTGHRYTATCGQTALAAAMVCATPPIETTQQAIDLMTSMTREMMGKGWADSPNGNTTTASLRSEALLRGFTVADPYIQWQDPIPDTTLHPLLLKWAGIKPIVLMFTNGQALKAVDGSHAELGLHGHFICVVGIEPRGYVCMDGDNNQIADHLPIYPFAAIHNAHPTGYLMIEPQGIDEVEVKTLQAQLLDAQMKLAAASAQVTSLTGQLATAGKTIADLQAELAAAGTSGAIEAIAAVRALATALARVQ